MRNLDDSILQSSGVKLNPLQYAKRYSAELSYSERPRWIVACTFAQFLVDTEKTEIKKEEAVSFEAGELVGILYEKS